jgi:hypothetical protein
LTIFVKNIPMNPPAFPNLLLHLAVMAIALILFFAGAFFLMWYYFKQTRKNILPVVTDDEKKVILPLRLQAYERFVLFLERIHPSNLVMRLNSPDLTAMQLQSLLVRTIREEFEYNLSQQLYISDNSWELIKNAKEETIAMINQASAKTGENAHSSGLVKAVFEVSVAKGKLPVETAIDEIKKEMQKML